MKRKLVASTVLAVSCLGPVVTSVNAEAEDVLGTLAETYANAVVAGDTNAATQLLTLTHVNEAYRDVILRAVEATELPGVLNDPSRKWRGREFQGLVKAIGELRGLDSFANALRVKPDVTSQSAPITIEQGATRWLRFEKGEAGSMLQVTQLGCEAAFDAFAVEHGRPGSRLKDAIGFTPTFSTLPTNDAVAVRIRADACEEDVRLTLKPVGAAPLPVDGVKAGVVYELALKQDGVLEVPFPTKVGSQYTVHLAGIGSEVDPVFEVFDPLEGEAFSANDDCGYGLNARVDDLVGTGGSWSLRMATATDAEGSVRLYIQERLPITLDRAPEALAGILVGGDDDAFVFPLEAGRWAVSAGTSKDSEGTDLMLHILKEGQTQVVAQNDDRSVDDLNPTACFDVQQHSNVVAIVDEVDGNSGGKYWISAKPATEETCPQDPAAREL